MASILIKLNTLFALTWLFFVICLTEKPLFSMVEDAAYEVLDAHHDLSRHHVNNGQHQLNLHDQLESNQLSYDLKNIDLAFANTDELFTRAIVKIQQLDKNNQVVQETISTLGWFLTKPHDGSSIVDIIEGSIGRQLLANEKFLFVDEPDLSLFLAVKTLWQRNIIDDKTAQKIFLTNSLMTSKELIRLVENGAAKTASGYLIQLRTGDTYGDVLKLFDNVSSVLSKLQLSDDEEIASFSYASLIKKPIPKEIVEAFNEHGLNPEEAITDAMVIGEMRKHFLFISRIGMPIRFRPGTIDFNPLGVNNRASVERANYRRLVISPRNISALLVGNHYFNNINASMTNAIFINPIISSYAGSFSTDHRSIDWWFAYTEGYLGAGANYTVNFDQGTFWSNGQPSYLSIGGMVGGWRNYLVAGFSLSSALSNGIGIGANASISISRAHDVIYLGQYPMDGKIAAIRGLHKIEIDDNIGYNTSIAVAVNATAVPLTVAFRAGIEHTTNRIYRTHADLKKTQAMLRESDIPGVLFLLGKEIKATRLPKFENPEQLQDGDELVETKLGRLSGAFVLGLESVVPIAAARVGGTVEVSGEFELGLRRLPNNKFEVSIEPKQVHEMGLFASILNILSAGYIKSIALARKQIFIFDFLREEAKRAYYDLIHHGQLPISEEIEVYSEDRGPEYLLTEFRAQNTKLVPIGVALTYLEKVRIATSKKAIGLNAPMLPAILSMINSVDKRTRKSKERVNLRFEGIDREFIRSHAKSVATNGLTAVRRSTYGGRRSKGEGFSGRENQDLFVTHERIHSIDADATHGFVGNKWQFDSLLVHAALEDTIITDDEENEMAGNINRLFSSFIGPFEYKDSKAPRKIDIERKFTKKDLDELTHSKARDRIAIASHCTGIHQYLLTMLLKKLKNKHPDHQGLIVKQFIQTQPGLTGFAAIHQLLGGKPEDLFIRTESGYSNAVLAAKKFITNYTAIKDAEKKQTLNLTPLYSKKNKKRIKLFLDEARHHLRVIDHQLRLLYGDQYLLDERSPLQKIYGAKKIQELIDAGVRQDKTSFRTSLCSVRQTVLDLIDLKSQNFTEEDRKIIRKMAGEKRLTIKDQVEKLRNKYGHQPISVDMTAGYLKNRIERSFNLIAKIDERIRMAEEDRIMQKMDMDYIEKLIRGLLKMRKQIAKLCSLTHLSNEDRAALKKKFDIDTHFPLNIFRKKRYKNFKFDGVLADIYNKDIDENIDERMRQFFENINKDKQTIHDFQ